MPYEGDWRITKTAQPAIPTLHDDENDRADHSFLARYTHTVGRSGEISPYYRFQFTDFHGSIDRQDNLHTLGLVFAWHFCPRSTARVFVNYDLRDSSHAAIDSYQKLSTGLGFNLTFRF